MRSSARSLGGAAVLALAGLVLVWIGSSRTWAVVSPSGVAGPAAGPPVRIHGSTVAPALLPLALLAVAGLVAAAAVRRAARVLAGVVVVLAGLALVALAVSALVTQHADAASAHPPRRSTYPYFPYLLHVSNWEWLPIVAGVLLAVAGAIALGPGRRWPGLSARYERTADTARAAPRTEWEAIERGEDPTAEERGSGREPGHG